MVIVLVGRAASRSMRFSATINHLASGLLDDYRLPDLAYSSLIVNDEAFAILVGVDELQANLAGSEVWRGSVGVRWRSRLMADADRLSAQAQRLGLSALSARLGHLVQVLASQQT